MKKIILGILLVASLASASETIIQTYRRTYSASSTVLPNNPATDICVIKGNASYKVRVTSVTLSATQTTAGVNLFYLVKRSTADQNTGSVMTVVPHDSKSGSAVSVPTTYTYTNTPGVLGTSVGNIRTVQLVAPAPAGTTGSPVVFDLDQDFTSGGVVLYSGESLAVNMGGAALPSGMNVSCSFEWTEE